MKKLFLLLSAIAIVSCTPNQDVVLNAEEKTTLSQLDGDLLSFKDEDSFIKEYSILSEMKSSQEIQDWISSKKHKSLLNTSSDSIAMESDTLPNSRIIYSDAIKAIFNSESKIKIGGKTIWIDGSNFYLLSSKDVDKNSKALSLFKDKLLVYGQLQSLGSSSSLTNRNVIPNENRIKTYIVALPDGKRHIIDLYNETLVFYKGEIASSKMFLRVTPQYKSCSFWRCTWKTDESKQWRLFTNLSTSNVMWKIQNYNTYSDSPFYGQRNFLIAAWGINPPYAINYQNFNVIGEVKIITPIVGTSGTFATNLSWY